MCKSPPTESLPVLRLYSVPVQGMKMRGRLLFCSMLLYAVKEAIITKEHLPTVRDIDIFYMDIRAYGKDFDRYIDSAKVNMALAL